MVKTFDEWAGPVEDWAAGSSHPHLAGVAREAARSAWDAQQVEIDRLRKGIKTAISEWGSCVPDDDLRALLAAGGANG